MTKELWVREDSLTRYESELAEDIDLVTVAGYIRTGTADEASEQSILAQAEAIRGLCREHYPAGCRIIWIADRGASANQPCWQPGIEPGRYRKGLTILVQLVKRGGIRCVCAYDLSRLTRSPGFWFRFRKECLTKHDVRLLLATGPVRSIDGHDADIGRTFRASLACCLASVRSCFTGRRSERRDGSRRTRD